MTSKRFLMVPDDSSAARMPRPGATIASATLCNSVRSMASSCYGFVFGTIANRDIANRDGSLRAGRSLGGLQHLDAGQCLAFEPFEERAACGRGVGEPGGDAGGIERRHRV